MYSNRTKFDLNLNQKFNAADVPDYLVFVRSQEPGAKSHKNLITIKCNCRDGGKLSSGGWCQRTAPFLDYKCDCSKGYVYSGSNLCTKKN